MERQPVNSTMIAACGYDAETQTMEVQFTGGAIYRYANVPPSVHQSLITAPSIGKQFYATIRDKYPAKKVESPTT